MDEMIKQLNITFPNIGLDEIDKILSKKDEGKKKLIKWAESEIQEYQIFIKMLKDN